jgi:hypothetical protein
MGKSYRVSDPGNGLTGLFVSLLLIPNNLCNDVQQGRPYSGRDS